MNLSTPTDYAEEIISGNRAALSRAITFAESKKPEHQEFAQKLIHDLLPHTGKSKRIAITGVPGAGKSTFIEAFGLFLIHNSYKVAVLAVDPSSKISRGSILGDKTRMEELSKEELAFIRPSATGGSLGGITARTFEALLLCEAAGFDVILVETVGVGQSETLVKDITDFFLYLQVAGTGDDLQGIKRGIMEMADLIFLNKVDLFDAQMIQDSKMDLHRALQFLPKTDSGWKRKILKGSGYSNLGIDEVWQEITNYFELIENNGFLSELRQKQKLSRINDYLEEMLLQKIRTSISIQEERLKWEKQLHNNEITPYELAEKMLEKYFHST
ncbi:MAG: methylmalonyl Co-A mutase-associated GTPase MeaB [Flavobacteriaceae bacterium]|nr:methylmalonyl Co-A mutase-associated GTPase MeaB [Flavobacteriaceae bacterium]